ncbi:unnamed protein product, partial [Urochloa humidicola]
RGTKSTSTEYRSTLQIQGFRSPLPAIMSASAKPEDSAAAVPEGEAEAEVKGIGSGCELLYCGGTKFDTMDQKGGPQGRNLESPTRLRPLVGVDIRF